MADEIHDLFVKAYNNFDSRPLSGENLNNFYVNDLSKEVIRNIINTIEITERFRKILCMGHTGCGKSTILNKISNELRDNYHVIKFSVADKLNLMDIETIDILVVLYIQIVKNVKEKELLSDNMIKYVLERFDFIIEPVKESLQLNEIGFSLLGAISFKMKVESESRSYIRKAYKKKGIEELQKSISEVCRIITEQEDKSKAKDILVIIDDLDKLQPECAQKIFFEEFHLITMIDFKAAFTFPLSSYYSAPFLQITDKFTHEYINLVNLYDSKGNRNKASFEILKEVVLKRIDKKLITDDALNYLIESSGGLLRDLIKFLQDACNIASVDRLSVIDEKISKIAVQGKINEYVRLFDFIEYKEKVSEIRRTKSKENISVESLIYLLRYMFVLEYGLRGEKTWYDVHPCLKPIIS